MRLYRLVVGGQRVAWGHDDVVDFLEQYGVVRQYKYGFWLTGQPGDEHNLEVGVTCLRLYDPDGVPAPSPGVLGFVYTVGLIYDGPFTDLMDGVGEYVKRKTAGRPA